MIDEKLVNNWISIPKKKDEKKIALAVFKFNENEYLVCWQEGEKYETMITRGFSTKIKNIKIVNVQNVKTLDQDDRTYLFFQI